MHEIMTCDKPLRGRVIAATPSDPAAATDVNGRLGRWTQESSDYLASSGTLRSRSASATPRAAPASALGSLGE